MITQDQLLSAVRWAVNCAAMWAVSRGYVADENVPLIVGAAGALTMLCWGLAVHSPKNTIDAAANTKGVANVVMIKQAEADDHPNAKVIGPSDER